MPPQRSVHADVQDEMSGMLIFIVCSMINKII